MTTKKDLELLVSRINRLTNNPETMFAGVAPSSFNVGYYHIDSAYGGVALHQTADEKGSTYDISAMGHVPKKELELFLRGFVCALEYQKTLRWYPNVEE